MCPIATVLFLLSFSLPAVLSASPKHDGGTSSINVTQCFEISKVKNLLQEVNRCYLDIVQELLNKPLIQPRICSYFTDFEKKYDNFLTNLKNDCSSFNFGPSDSNYNTSIVDVLKVTLDKEKFTEFVNDNGLDCLYKVSKPVRTCRDNTISLYQETHPYDDNTTFSFWKRTSILTVDDFNCRQQDKFINCTMQELNAKCGKKSIRFINSTLDIFKPKCELAKNFTNNVTLPISTGAASTVYWIVGVIVFVAVAVITTIYIKKRKSVESDTSLEMK